MTTPTLEMHTLRDGFGQPIVLLHAYPLDHRMWAAAADALPGNPTVLAVDLPGLGQSPVPTVPPSLEASADGVAATLRRAGVGRAVVVGISMGGYVALALADRHPELVAGIGLVDTKSTADTAEARANRLRIADEVSRSQTVDAVLGMPGVLLGETSKRSRSALTARVEEWIRTQRPGGVAWSQRAMAARPDRTGVLAAFGGPVTVVVGEEDGITSPSDAEHMVAAAPGAVLVRVHGAGHLSAIEEPAVVAEALGGLIERSDG